MKVDIWSDIRCPFCYIGKRKFEIALEQFPHKDNIEVVWHSFELDLNLKTDPSANSLERLAQRKGMTIQQAQQMVQHVSDAAKEADLHFDTSKTVTANSFNAHRLIQLAKTKGLGKEAKEQLLKAFFIDSKNIDDDQTLTEIGSLIGLDPDEVEKLLSSNAYEEAVRQDEMQAQNLGINGVPFFIFNNKYAVSGAQSPATFLQALEQSWGESEEADELDIIVEGKTCPTNGDCN
ncbi:MAG: DsbA family oxidoreductase [Abditibacteriaceae bacterium]